MRKIFICTTIVFAVFVSSLFATNEMMIYNKTGFDIYEIYISPERNTENWGLNKIPFDVVGNDSYIALDLNDYADFTEVNIKLVDKDGAVYYKVGIFQKEISRLEVTMEDHSYLLVEKENWNVTFINGSGEEIKHISISPVAMDQFLDVASEDDSVVVPGDELIVVLNQFKANNSYDILFVTGDGQTVLKKSVYLSDGAYIILK